MSTAIALMPVMDIEAAVSRRNAMVEYVQRIMVSGVDYGTIPGTGSKPTLLKPGAEKLSSMFALHPTFPVVESVQDWTGKDHGGEPFFYFWYKCILWRGDEPVGEGDGSCNSWEKKYRYRKAERACPACGALSIMRSKYPPKNEPNAQPGWYCRECKAAFPFTDPAIKDQALGYVPNTDVADQVNTLKKMAQKRALIAAVLVTCNASEFFTQDLEDIIDVDFHEVQPTSQNTRPSQTTQQVQSAPDAPPPPAAPTNGNGKTDPGAEPMSETQRKALHAVGQDFYGPAWNDKRAELVKAATKGRTTSSSELTNDEAAKLISGIRQRINARNAAAPVEQESMLAEAAAANPQSAYSAGL